MDFSAELETKTKEEIAHLLLGRVWAHMELLHDKNCIVAEAIARLKKQERGDR